MRTFPWSAVVLLVWAGSVGLILLFTRAVSERPRHEDTPRHKHNMRRAELCMEGAAHFHGLAVEAWVRQAVRLCGDCGCPVDMWPASVVKLHVIGAL